MLCAARLPACFAVTLDNFIYDHVEQEKSRRQQQVFMEL